MTTKNNCLSKNTILSLAPRRVIRTEVRFKCLNRTVCHFFSICIVVDHINYLRFATALL